MPRDSVITGAKGEEVDYYEIGVKQELQQILPPGGSTNFNKTTVWSYYSIAEPTTFNYPAYTIEAQADRPVRVKWVNKLVDSQNNYLPHILPVTRLCIGLTRPARAICARPSPPSPLPTAGRCR